MFSQLEFLARKSELIVRKSAKFSADRFVLLPLSRSTTVLDLRTGDEIRAPKHAIPALEDAGLGNLRFGVPDDNGFHAVRGAKLLDLQILDWIEADRITDDELRRRLLEDPCRKRGASDLQRMDGNPVWAKV